MRGSNTFTLWPAHACSSDDGQPCQHPTRNETSLPEMGDYYLEKANSRPEMTENSNIMTGFWHWWLLLHVSENDDMFSFGQNGIQQAGGSLC
jgi:hypothetical protein